ncbi:hypothetical protein ACQR5W_11770 [Xanthomonas sacchari]
MSSDLEAYTKAMCAGQLSTCMRIEQRHGLYGYPPEVVCAGLAAADRGESVDAAVDAYFAGGAQ